MLIISTPHHHKKLISGILVAICLASVSVSSLHSNAFIRFIRMMSEHARLHHFMSDVVKGPCFERSRHHPNFSVEPLFDCLENLVVRRIGANDTYYQPCLGQEHPISDADMIRRFIDVSTLRYFDRLADESQHLPEQALLSSIKPGDFTLCDLSYIRTGSEDIIAGRDEHELIDELNLILESTIQAYEVCAVQDFRKIVAATLSVLIGGAAVACMIAQIPHFHVQR